MGAMGSKEYKYRTIDGGCESGERQASTHSGLRDTYDTRLWLVLIVFASNFVTFLGTNFWLYLQREPECTISGPEDRLGKFDIMTASSSRVHADGHFLAPFMSGVDRSYHINTFNTFDFNVTRYTERETDARGEVEKRWADLGIYG